MTITGSLISKVGCADLDGMPAEALRCAKRSIYDTLAVAWAGSRLPGPGDVAQLALSEMGSTGGKSTLWGFGSGASPMAAALVNATSAGALDYDSIHLDAVVHADAVVIPAALATAEHVGAGGREFLRAVVLGVEVACRLGLAASSRRGWFATAIYGIFGATVAAGILSKLSPAQMNEALALALNQCAGTHHTRAASPLIKAAQFGLAARGAVFSAMLARQGVQEECEIFAGNSGLYTLYDLGNPATIVNDLGMVYHNTGTILKKYPCCSCNHLILDALIALESRHEIVLEDIVGIEIVITPRMNMNVGSPFAPDGDVMQQSQFNLRYAVACALLRGKFSLEEISQTALSDPEIYRLTQKMDVVVDSKTDGIAGPCVITIRMNSRAPLQVLVSDASGTLGPPIALKDLERKAADCFRHAGNADGSRLANALWRKIEGLEAIENMSDFFNFESPSKNSGVSP